MARAFYRVPRAAWADPMKRPLDCVACDQGAQWVYVLAPDDPCRSAEIAAGIRLGGRLCELADSARMRFLRDDGLGPRMIFAGDDPADYL